MPRISQEDLSQLKFIKDCVSEHRDEFRENCDRYNDSMKEIFIDSLNESEKNVLRARGMPVVQINILEAYISRMRGEFSQFEPSYSLRPANLMEPSDPYLLNVVDGSLRNILFEANNEGFEYKVFSQASGGGFSVMEVSTDYKTPMSFEQKILLKAQADPTLCGF